MADRVEGAAVPVGALLQVFPQRMVRGAIAAEAAGERRRRSLPAPLVVYLNLALWIYPDRGYTQVLAELIDGMPYWVRTGWRRATSASIAEARRRLGPEVMTRLFRAEAEASPGPEPSWRGRPVCAIGGATLPLPDTADNRAAFGGPEVRLLALACCATGSIVDAVWAPYQITDETLAQRLLPAVRAGMLVVLGPGIVSPALVRGVTAAGAHLLYEAPAGSPGPPEAEGVRIAGDTGLVTTLLDPGEAPVSELAALYEGRWRPGEAFALGRRALRSHHADGVIAEIWSLLCLCQAACRLRRPG